MTLPKTCHNIQHTMLWQQLKYHTTYINKKLQQENKRIKINGTRICKSTKINFVLFIEKYFGFIKNTNNDISMLQCFASIFDQYFPMRSDNLIFEFHSKNNDCFNNPNNNLCKDPESNFNILCSKQNMNIYNL